MVIALAGLTVFLTSRQTELAEGTAVPPASPSATAPSTATPVTGAIAYPPGSLPALLGLAPDWLDDEDQALPVQAAYADIAGWLNAAGLDPASADAADLRGALDPLGSRGLDTEWRRVYGFDLRDIDQVLAVGQAPNLVLIMPGRYDADALYATWVASGYQAVEVEGTTVWSLSPGERTRAALALLQAREVNLLVLDEPTNHLDLPAIEQLERAVDAFPGTVLLVTHDRRMLAGVRGTRRWVVEGGRLHEE